jgi:hypothetical protein
MAELYSTRRKAKSSRPRSVDQRRIAERSGLHLQRGSLSGSLSINKATTVQMIILLREVSRLLSEIYCTCVVAELALQRQSADHNRNIVAMLRKHVSDPIGRQVTKLDSLVVELGGVAQEASL